jgi:2-iminobutanoate/2-iminopropanoate deaminase
MNTPVMPSSIAPPAAAYSHAVLSVGVTRWLHTAGVVPFQPDGSVPDGLAEQIEAVWANIAAMLVEADMLVTDIVSITTYVVQGQDLAAVIAGRDRAMGGHRPASTMLVVPELIRPEWKVEVAVVAAAP